MNPSGHLTDTWTIKYEDIPYANEYSYLNGNVEEDYYKEDIYVGYRYFDTFGIPVKYPFGFGLSYTKFDIKADVSQQNSDIVLTAEVANAGEYSGKEVVQVYASCPDGKLIKEYQRLVGFAKTKELKPKETEELKITIPLTLLASYDEESSSLLLEAGDYIIRVGDSSKKTEAVCVLQIDDKMIISKHQNICPIRDELEKIAETQNVEKCILEKENIPRIVLDSQAIETIV